MEVHVCCHQSNATALLITLHHPSQNSYRRVGPHRTNLDPKLEYANAHLLQCLTHNGAPMTRMNLAVFTYMFILLNFAALLMLLLLCLVHDIVSCQTVLSTK